MTGSQCKQFCITHFKEMITNQIGRVSMKRIARYCGQCAVWFWRKFWLSVYCPCCHKKMHDELKNPTIPADIKRKHYFRIWRRKNRDRVNEYKRNYYKNHKQEVHCPVIIPSASSSNLHSVRAITGDTVKLEKDVGTVPYG